MHYDTTDMFRVTFDHLEKCQVYFDMFRNYLETMTMQLE